MYTFRQLAVHSSVVIIAVLSFLGYFVMPARAVTTQPARTDQTNPTNQTPSNSGSNPACRVNPSFPENILRWCELITREATNHGLDPDLVAALILQESGGDPVAYSRSGAVGLMQVMPRDGIAARFECPNGPCFAKRPTIQELQQPGFNVEYGTRMLAGLIERHGEIRPALKSYGPMDVGFSYADKVLAIWDRYGS